MHKDTFNHREISSKWNAEMFESQAHIQHLIPNQKVHILYKKEKKNLKCFTHNNCDNYYYFFKYSDKNQDTCVLNKLIFAYFRLL